MRVVFLNRYFYPDHSATSQMLSDLAFFLAGAGHEVSVVTSCQRYDDAAAGLALRERIDGVDVHRVRTTRFGRGKLLGRALDYVTFYLAAERDHALTLSSLVIFDAAKSRAPGPEQALAAVIK